MSCTVTSAVILVCIRDDKDDKMDQLLPLMSDSRWFWCWYSAKFSTSYH